MLKNLTITLCVAALLPACVIGNDDSASDSNSSNATTNVTGTTTDGGTTEAPTTANPTTSTTGATTGQTTGMTSGTTGETTDSATEASTGMTTDVPTTDGTTNMTGMTTGMTSGTTGETTDMTTGETGGVVGCGWAEEGYYACSDMGGVADAEDPMMTDPIACPPGLMEGVVCDNEKGPIGDVGCCNQGINYFCTGGKVFADDCSME